MTFGHGPLGFKVYGMGWEDDVPFLIVLIANGGVNREIKLIRTMGKWWVQNNDSTLISLNTEEQSYASKMWASECQKRGLDG